MEIFDSAAQWSVSTGGAEFDTFWLHQSLQ